MIKFWQRWLMILADIVIIAGLAMLLFGGSGLFAPLNEPTFALFFGETVPPAALEYHRFLFGVLGATTVGWGVLIFFVAWQPFGRGERWAWWALVASALAWFTLDTIVALSFGATVYALFNLTVLIAIDLPLLATARSVLAGDGRLAPA